MTRLVFNRDGGKTDEFGHVAALTRLFSGEVITGFTVAQSASPAMTVAVSTGFAALTVGSGATAYKYYVGSDALETVTIATADGSNPRNDLIVCYVDTSVTPSTGVTNNSNNMFKIISVAGTAATVPADPSVGAIQTAIGSASYPYAILARVRVTTADTLITDSQIDNIQTPVTLAVTSSSSDGWIASPNTMVYGANNGTKEHTLTISGDKTANHWVGQKLKFVRGTTPPTQCADLEASSSQYASKSSPTGMTFTDDFTVEAWIKPESYPGTGAAAMITSRINSAVTQGWIFQFTDNGRIVLAGYTTGGGTNRFGSSYNSIPLGRWVHVAATLDMSANTCTMYINGESVPVAMSGSATALIQAGDLVVGNFTSDSQYFDGKIADVRVWNIVRTASQVRENMNQQLTGSETNLISYYKLNGNFNDSTSNANNLTAQGSATALNADNPMHTNEYGIVTAVSYSSPTTTVTVFTGTGYNIPAMTLTTYFSTDSAPAGFPSRNNFMVDVLIKNNETIVINSVGVWAISLGGKIHVPIGEWTLEYQGTYTFNSSIAGIRSGFLTLASSTPTSSVYSQDMTGRIVNVASTTLATATVAKNSRIILTSATDYTLYGAIDTATGAETWLITATQGATIISALLAWA